MIEKLPENLAEKILSNASFSRYLGSLNEAKGHTPRSWLWDGVNSTLQDPSVILESWKHRLAALVNGSEYDKIIYDFDVKSVDKWGPQGGHPPLIQVLEETVLPTFARARGDEPAAFSDPDWDEAISQTIKYFHSLGIKGLRPMTAEHAMKHTLSMYAERLASNSGYPDFARRKVARVWKQAVLDAQSGDYQRYPAILLFRYYRKKLRMVWMFPFAANIAESQYYTPLFERMRKVRGLVERFFAPWTGFEQVRKLVTDTYLNHAHESIAASDFSATDEHFTWSTTRQVLRVLSALFQKQFSSGLELSLKHMHEIPLLIGKSSWITGPHGVSSGSMWTNFVETVFDRILAFYAEIKSHGAVKGLFAIGDDMAWLVKNSFASKFQVWLEKLGESVGQVINATKTMIHPDRVKTLQRLFQRGYRRQESDELRAVYPTIRALNSLLFPERMHSSKDWNFDMFAVRVFTILENCVDHPLFEEFVRFVLTGNARLRNWVKQSDAKLDRASELAKLLPGLNPTYNQEKKEAGLSKFNSIRVARAA